jgi:CDP-glycerol glycerophosphotransferase (TagB/SpsB family)
MFGSVVVVAFQITFRAEIYVNNFFYFLKIIFDISILKQSKKYKPYSILIKKNFEIQ